MLIARRCAAGVALVAALVLAGVAAAAPPAPGEKKPETELVPVESSGEGIAPGAPQCRAEHGARLSKARDGRRPDTPPGPARSAAL